MLWRTASWAAMVTAAGLGIGWVATTELASGQPRPEEARNRELDRTVEGRVSKWLKNDHDDVDGLTLENGTEVHFPPHIGRAVARTVKVGDTVKVQGRDETRPRGERVFEAARIESQGTTIDVDRPRGPRGRGPEAGAEYEEILHELREIRRLIESQSRN